MMQNIYRIGNAMQDGDGLPGITSKLVIEGQDVYLKVALFEGRLVFVDVTLSAVRGPSAGGAASYQVTQLEATKTDNARAMVEMLCHQAGLLLQGGVWSWEDLCFAWAGTRFEPSGMCAFPGGVMGTVRSPLDAVARLIRERFAAWRADLEVQDAAVVGPVVRGSAVDRPADRVMGAGS